MHSPASVVQSMNSSRWFVFVSISVLWSSLAVAAGSGCPEGGYSVIQSPDGGSLSLLFDQFVLEANGVKTCSLAIPLNLPAATSLGIYRVDYRGYANLSRGQAAELSVDYALGTRENGRSFRRRVRGAHEGDYVFTENLGAGLMRRVGCGDQALLNVAINLTLQTGAQPNGAMASVDSADGTAKGGLLFKLNYQPCH